MKNKGLVIRRDKKLSYKGVTDVCLTVLAIGNNNNESKKKAVIVDNCLGLKTVGESQKNGLVTGRDNMNSVQVVIVLII